MSGPDDAFDAEAAFDDASGEAALARLAERIADDPAAARAYVRAAAFACDVRAAVDARLARERHGAASSRLRALRPRPRAFIAMAASLVVAAAIALVVARHRHLDVPTIGVAAIADGSHPWCETAEGRRDLALGAAIERGARIHADRGVTVRYADEATSVALGDDAVAAFAGPAAKRIALDRGAAALRVAPQRHDAPLVVATPDAQATVVGTRLRIDADARGSRLAVASGSVAFRRLADGAETLVPAGERADAGEPRLASARDEAVVLARWDFEDRPAWAVGVPTADAAIGGIVMQAQVNAQFPEYLHVWVRDFAHGLFAWDDGLVCEAACFVSADADRLELWLRDETQRADYTAVVPLPALGRWTRFAVDGTAFRPSDPADPDRRARPGDRITSFQVGAHAHGRLAIDDLVFRHRPFTDQEVP